MRSSTTSSLCFPKTTATSNLLDRSLITDDDVRAMLPPAHAQRTNQRHARHRNVELGPAKTLRPSVP